MKQIKSAKGYTLLEQAMLIPIFIFLVLAALDINKALQAYGALQQGVKSSLRCLYPVDGDCNSHAGAPAEALYNLKKTAAIPEWPLPFFRYEAEIGWLSAPQTYFSEPAATILDEVRYTVAEDLYELTVPIHPAQARLAYYSMTADSPLVNNGGGSLTELSNPQIVFKNASNSPYPLAELESAQNPINLSVGGRIRADSNKDEKRIGALEFTVPLLDSPELPCYQSQHFNSKQNLDHRADFAKQSCSTEIVNLIFHISGETGCSRGAAGAVQISINNSADSVEPARRRWRDLGGRLLCGSSGNFYARGALYVNDNYGKEEFTQHADIQVKRGVPVRIKFKLVRTKDGEISWYGNKIKVYTSLFRKITDTARCQGNYPLSSKECGATDPKTGQGIPSAAIIETEPVCTEVASSTTITKCGSKLDYSFNACNSISTRLIEPDSRQCSYRNVEKCCDPVRDSRCSNYGVTSDPNGASADKALKICPIRHSREDLLDAPFFSERQIDLPLRQPLLYARDRCDKPDRPGKDVIPLEFRQYPKFEWKKQTPAAALQINNSGRHPQEFKQQNPELNCDFIQPILLTFDENSLPNPTAAAAGSLFIPPQPLICDWQQALKKEIQEFHQITPEIYFKAVRQKLMEKNYSSKPDLSCYDFTPDYSTVQNWEDIPGGPFKGGEFPAECQNGSAICQAELAGFTGSPGQGPEHDLNQAVQSAGWPAIQAAIPWARLDCRGANCVNFRITEDAEVFSADASIEISLNSLLGYPVTISYHDQETWEGQFLHPRSLSRNSSGADS